MYPPRAAASAWRCVLAARQHSENSSRCLFLQTIILIFAPIENLYLQNIFIHYHYQNRNPLAYEKNYSTVGAPAGFCTASAYAALPFKTTTITSDGKFAEGFIWYTIQIGSSGGLVIANNGAADKISLKSTSLTYKDAELWCFVGNATQGYRLYNKEAGAGKVLASPKDHVGQGRRLGLRGAQRHGKWAPPSCVIGSLPTPRISAPMSTRNICIRRRHLPTRSTTATTSSPFGPGGADPRLFALELLFAGT